MNAAVESRLEECKVINGMVQAGDDVLARNHDATMVTGKVEEIVPWGCPWVDRSWTRATVVIRDHDDRLSGWNPELVEKIDL